MYKKLQELLSIVIKPLRESVGPRQDPEYDLLAAENDLLYKAVKTSNVQQIRELAATGRDINAPCDNGASVLFVAILIANVEVIRTLLELGADPNFQAVEPALSVYADTPLDVAMQARLVMDWEKYNPIVQILIDYGATRATESST